MVLQRPRRGLLLSLIGVALTTAAAAWIDGGRRALLGLALRTAAGVFSAWALVCASSWCLAELARRMLRIWGLGSILELGSA